MRRRIPLIIGQFDIGLFARREIGKFSATCLGTKIVSLGAQSWPSHIIPPFSIILKVLN